MFLLSFYQRDDHLTSFLERNKLQWHNFIEESFDVSKSHFNSCINTYPGPVLTIYIVLLNGIQRNIHVNWQSVEVGWMNLF
jgi:hypothetical protein